MRHPLFALVVLLAAACAPRTPPRPLMASVPVTPDVMQADSIAGAMLQLAFTADAAGRDPDSLYMDDAEIIANGEPRATAPRFAGVGSGGHIQLGSSRIAVTGDFVWGSIEYRWVPGVQGKPLVEGRATVVIGRRRDGAWRILHIHSSTTPPPETDAPRPARTDTTRSAPAADFRERAQAVLEELPRIASRIFDATPGAKILSSV